MGIKEVLKSFLKKITKYNARRLAFKQSTVALLHEFSLIEEKKSILSARERRWVVARVKFLQEQGIVKYTKTK